MNETSSILNNFFPEFEKTSEIKKLLDKIIEFKNDKDKMFQILNQINLIIFSQREECSKNIEQLTKFIEHNFKILTVKLAVKIFTHLSKLLLHNSSIHLILGYHFYKIFFSILLESDNKEEDNKYLIKNIGEIIKINGSHLSKDIKSSIDDIVKRFLYGRISTRKKITLIQILIEFINSAPIISFNKMTKTKSIQKLIAENFKHSDIEIRNIISELAFAFFCLLKNRDNDIRKNYFQIIYDLIIGILGHITKDTDIFAIHGSILLIKSISLIKDLFHAQSKHILLILFKFKDCSYLPIKNSIIEFIPDLTDYIRDNENIFEKFFDFLIDEYIRDINEYTNSLILLSLKKLSSSVEKNMFWIYADKIIICLKIRFEKKNYIIKKDEIECLTELFINYNKSILKYIELKFILYKIFECGFNNTHVNLLKKLIELYSSKKDDEPTLIKLIILCINLISIILSQKFDLNNSFFNISHNHTFSNLSKAEINKYLKNFTSENYQKISELLINYVFIEQNNKSSFEEIKLMMTISAIKLLKIIDHPDFSKDIILFYQKNCLPLIYQKIKSTLKIEVLSLLNANWFEYNKNDDEIKLAVEYVIEDLLKYYQLEKNENIKKSILVNFTEKFDSILSIKEYYTKIILLFENSENSLKVEIMRILCRLKKYEPNTISVFQKREIMRIINILKINSDASNKEKEISLLCFYIKNFKDSILDYFDNSIFEILLREINNNEEYYSFESESLSDTQEKESNDDLNLKIISILTELISSPCNFENGKKEEFYYKYILESCINILMDSTEINSQEILLKAILTIFENSTKNWDVYSSFSKLIYILIEILKYSSSREVRIYCLKIFGYIGTMDPYKLDILLNLQNNALSNANNNLEGKNFQIFDENVTENNYQKNNKKKFMNDIMNYLNNMSDFQENSDYDVLTKKENNKNQLLIDVIIFLMNILNDVNKKENVKDVLIIIMKIIKHLKEKNELKNKNNNEGNIDSSENEEIDLILNLILQHKAKNLKKRNKFAIIYYIIFEFKNEALIYFGEILNLIIDSIKHGEFIDISLTILIELLKVNKQIKNNICQKLIEILLELLNKKSKEIGVILIKENSYISKIIDCFHIMDENISEYSTIILDQCFYILEILLIQLKKKNINIKPEEFENEDDNKINKNYDNIMVNRFHTREMDNKLKYNDEFENEIGTNFNYKKNLIINKKNSNIFDSKYINNNFNSLNCPAEENKDEEINHFINNDISFGSPFEKNFKFKDRTNIINNNFFKKLFNFIKKIISFDDSFESSPKLIKILRNYICFCSELRNEIFEFFISLSKRKPKQMKYYYPSFMKLKNKYKISRKKINISNQEDLIPNNNDNNEHITYNKFDYSLFQKYISINLDFLDENDEDVNYDFEKILDDFNPKNYSLKDDWKEWFLSCSKQLFNYSPNKILRYCSKLNDSLVNLYKYAFYEVWKKLNESQKIEMVSYLSIVINKESLPNDIRLVILNLIEFIERKQQYIEYFNNFELSKASRKCKVYAKELYYIENYYRLNNDKGLLKRIMDLYYELNLPESVVGIFIKEKNNPLFKKDNWFLILRQWDSALKIIEEKRKNEPPYNIDLIIDNFECLEGLSDWNNLLLLNEEIQNKKNDICIDENTTEKFDKINYFVAESALNLNKWEDLESCVSKMNPNNDDEKFDKTIYETILNINNDELSNSKNLIEEARISLLDKIKTLLMESYERAYKVLLLNDNLYQLEEIIQLKEYEKQVSSYKLNRKFDNYNLLKKKGFILNKDNLKSRWDKRMKLISEDSRAYEKILALRNLVLNYEEDYDKYLDLAKSCRENDEFQKSMNILERLRQKTNKYHISSLVTLNLSKCLFENNIIGDNARAKDEIEKIIKENLQFNENDEVNKKLSSKFYCYYGFILMNELNYNKKVKNEYLDNKEKEVNNILKYLELATQNNPNNYKAWHLYGLLNYRFFEYAGKNKINYSINAIKGFTKSICIGKNMSKILQDLLLLLDIWFRVGTDESIDKLINQKLSIIPLENWFIVIPQLLARINVTNPLIRKTLILLLKKIGSKNPRRLTYALTVLKNSKSKARAEAVSLILEDIKKEHEQLFKESELIVNELNRCALCLHERWIETIEESAKLFYQTNDLKNSTKILVELHEKMKLSPKTMNEIHFHHEYRSDLNEAYILLLDFLNNDNMMSFKEAWNIYQNCYISMTQKYSNIGFMDLKSISPSLFKFREGEIEIPGIHQNMDNESSNSIVKISSFSPKLIVLNSKENPRKIIIYGNDGKEYLYLLKGHEDIRQDERVMQLFGVINTLLSKDSDTKRKNLSIKRYPVIPLSHNTGIIGWVSNCDTLHQLIKDYRTKNNIPVNIEYRLIIKFHYKSDSCLCMNKLEVFQHALSYTIGNDINKILWIKSQSAEDWLDRRTNYSRSLAVMSIVGYILGLGDRHPSNIMLNRISGKIIHIDFGDCFEVAMKRNKFPEKVPFRLTRMLIKALEIGGIEGSFRITCENVMRVMRENKDTLNVILSAFVHDPLTSFRLLVPLMMKIANKNKIKKEDKKEHLEKNIINIMINKNKKADNELEKKRMGSDERQLYQELEEKDDFESDYLNQTIKIVLERISDKLKGTDFNNKEELKINEQVRRLINQATSHENLSQSYLGWCPFW